MSEDTKQSETQYDPPLKLHLYYRRLLTTTFIAIIVTGIWCLMPFWKKVFSISPQFPGFYWLFVVDSAPVLFRILLVTLGGLAIFCVGQVFRSTYPEEVRQHLMRIGELRNTVILVGVALGLAIAFRLGMRTLLLDFIKMENVGSVATEKHVYHLSFYNTGAFSNGVPYGLIECDGLDIVCTQVAQILTRGILGSGQPRVTYDDRSGILVVLVEDVDYRFSGKHPTLRYEDITHTLYVEGNGQIYYSYQPEE